MKLQKFQSVLPIVSLITSFQHPHQHKNNKKTSKISSHKAWAAEKGKLPQLTFQLQLFDGPSCAFLLARPDRNRFCRLSFFCLRNYFRLLFSTSPRVLFSYDFSNFKWCNVNKFKLKPRQLLLELQIEPLFRRRVNKWNHFVVSREIDRELMTVGISALLPSIAQDKEKKNLRLAPSTALVMRRLTPEITKRQSKVSLALSHPSIDTTTIETKSQIPICKYPRPSFFRKGDSEHRMFMDD